MTSDDLTDFINCIRYSDAWFEYRKKRYFVQGCVCDFGTLGVTDKCELSVFELDVEGLFSSCAFKAIDRTPERCIAKLIKGLSLGGRPFMDVYRSVKWVLPR